MKYLLVLVCLSLFPLSAFADDQSDGCGLGWQVTQKTTFSATTTRGTTNGFVPPTFGMTSGTMGCARHDLAKKDEPAAIYAVNNYETLTVEMAEGRGEILTGFARTLGCDDGAISAFGQMTQKNYRNLPSGALDMFRSVKTQISLDPVLAVSCGV